MQHSDNKYINWNDGIKRQLLGQGLARLPHAMLLVGPVGVGKTAFAEDLAALLLCEATGPDLLACDECHACRWLHAGNHPDFRRVAPDDENEAESGSAEKAAEKNKKRASNSIRIDQIRELEGFVFVGSHRNGNRVVLITEADAMNPPAANALLKILEEPPATVYFILITIRSKALLPTLRSRCRVISFGPPDGAAAANWLLGAGLEMQAKRYLDLAGGAPMRVAQWKDQGQLAPIDALVDSLISPPSDPMVLAARWDGLLKGDGMFRMENLVEGVQRWLFDLTQERMAGEVRYHAAWPRPKGVQNLNPQGLLAAWREIGQFRRSARHPLNQLLFLENMAAHFLRALRPMPS
ncbi:MAG: DNA polymerase III subunit delta' [Betaproteobacteria bacterium]|nr:DNA polymerase III subunit delta' [Betaproteobacteria bacterium]